MTHVWTKGEEPHYNWYQGHKILHICLKSNTSDVHKKCKIQVSTTISSATLCIKRCTPFAEIDDKGGEISIKILWEVGFGYGYGQRGSNIEEIVKDQNFWTREAHK
jgi:hypothetical protein